MTRLPAPLPRHVNFSMSNLNATFPSNGIGLHRWVFIKAMGRLGNFLMDVANGLAAAIQMGRRGVIFERITRKVPDSDTSGVDLLGNVLTEAIEVPRRLHKSGEVVLALP